MRAFALYFIDNGFGPLLLLVSVRRSFDYCRRTKQGRSARRDALLRLGKEALTTDTASLVAEPAQAALAAEKSACEKLEQEELHRDAWTSYDEHAFRLGGTILVASGISLFLLISALVGMLR